MNLSKKTKCPCCHSSHLYTTGADQMCLDCDWFNAFELVESGHFEMELAELEGQEVQPKKQSSKKSQQNNEQASVA